MIIRSYIKAIIPLVILQFSIIISAYWMLGDYEVRRFNQWPISEWMINYQGGFVRRGMIGNILHHLALSGGVIPFLYPLVFSFYCTYILIFIVNYIYSRIQSTTVLVLALLIPGGIFHMALGPYFYTRKEILFIIHFGILCLLYRSIQKVNHENKTLAIGIFGAMTVMGGGFLTLVHEPYLFMAYPITLLLCVIIYVENKQNLSSKVVLLIYGLLIPIIFVICSLNHGDQTISQQIWDSYQLKDRIILAPRAPYTAAFSTGGLGWGFAQHLSTIYGVFITGTWVYWGFFWLMNGLVMLCIAYKISSRSISLKGLKFDEQEMSLERSTYVVSIIFAYLISSSMFLIASDYGRWIACATNLALLFAFATYKSRYIKIIAIKMHADVFSFVKKVEEILITKTVLFLIVLYELVLQMPECCIHGPEIFIRYDKFLMLFNYQ
jgi:hypothetical protein